jgi:exopolysaccharide production protein ExoQ
MNIKIATLVCFVGIAGLFYLDRDKSIRTSKALWLPVIWLWIIGSRPLSAWLSIWFGLNLDWSGKSIQGQLDGSPADAVAFAILLIAGIGVLVGRGRRTSTLLLANLPIVIYFGFCLVSVLWSPFPDLAFKRWFKAIGDVVMVFIIVTEPDPVAALQRLISRLGFLLLPASVLLIHYSPLGHSWDPDGNPMNTGVTTNKNTLGLITFLIALGVVWSFRLVLRSNRQPNRKRRIVAQGTLIAFSFAVLGMAHSATSIACFSLGAILILVTGLPSLRRSPGAVHAVVFTILLTGGLLMLFGGEGVVVHALGRQTNLTGRSDIWKAVIPACPNPLLGAGFESFWISPSAEEIYRHPVTFNRVNEAHNGYIEVYLNLGLVGLSLIVWILLAGYRNAVAAFRRNPEIGGLMLAYSITAAFYSITEAGFRMLTPSWIFLLLAIVAATGTVSGYLPNRVPPRRLRPARAPTWVEVS